MKRAVLILIVLSLTLILGSAAAGYAQTGRFQFTLPDTWVYDKATSYHAECVRNVNGTLAAGFNLYDTENKTPWPESQEAIAEALKAEFKLDKDAPWEPIEISGQKTVKVSLQLGDNATGFLTAVNAGLWHASILCSSRKGYEIDHEFENILATVTPRDSADVGFFRFGYAEVRYKGARIKKVGSNKYLKLDFTWRNAGTETTFFAVEVDVTAFQNGVQLQEGFLFDEKSEVGTKLMPGKSIDVTKVYELREAGGKIEFTVDKLLDFNHQYVDRKYSFTLKD